jgi:hypothetical protein
VSKIETVPGLMQSISNVLPLKRDWIPSPHISWVLGWRRVCFAQRKGWTFWSLNWVKLVAVNGHSYGHWGWLGEREGSPHSLSLRSWLQVFFIWILLSFVNAGRSQ